MGDRLEALVARRLRLLRPSPLMDGLGDALWTRRESVVVLTLVREARAEEEVEEVVWLVPLSLDVDEARDRDDPAPAVRTFLECCEEPVVGMLEEDVDALSLGRSTVSRTVRISVLILNFDFWLKMLMFLVFSASRSFGRFALRSGRLLLILP